MTCQIIKTEQTNSFADTEKKIEGGLDVPVMNEFYMQLASIDFDLSRDFYPINMAIKKAIEAVMHYYAYR